MLCFSTCKSKTWLCSWHFRYVYLFNMASSIIYQLYCKASYIIQGEQKLKFTWSPLTDSSIMVTCIQLSAHACKHSWPSRISSGCYPPAWSNTDHASTLFIFHKYETLEFPSPYAGHSDSAIKCSTPTAVLNYHKDQDENVKLAYIGEYHTAVPTYPQSAPEELWGTATAVTASQCWLWSAGSCCRGCGDILGTLKAF